MWSLQHVTIEENDVSTFILERGNDPNNPTGLNAFWGQPSYLKQVFHSIKNDIDNRNRRCKECSDSMRDRVNLATF